jgi:hypothetical protein
VLSSFFSCPTLCEKALFQQPLCLTKEVILNTVRSRSDSEPVIALWWKRAKLRELGNKTEDSILRKLTIKIKAWDMHAERITSLILSAKWPSPHILPSAVLGKATKLDIRKSKSQPLRQAGKRASFF